MAPLPRELRRLLENVVVAARDAAEEAARAALRALSVDRDEAHSGISDEDRALRVALRARARQLGGFDLLAAEVAYEQWHRMLFARFLAENDLLIHPSGVAVTMAECADLAEEEGESDAWMLAARYASQMLPGIFRRDDPSVRVRFARNDVATLERLLAGLPSEVFAADDSLGWVYQFWQSSRKKEVNSTERKIGGADLPPVTQLFTDHYMVAFLLENTLGAWWAGKHPSSPLLSEWRYLRFAEDGTPAAGAYEGWPTVVADLSVMDPCCGSGHFLVAAFEMLRRMREEEEGLTPQQAADAVLRDNLFGLELDGRCVQIAVFALAIAAWRVGGYRDLPTMSVACCGLPTRGTEQEWRSLARGDHELADALSRVYHLFKDADTLGSLIDPRMAAESDTLLGVDFERVAPLMHEAVARFGGDDPAQAVFARAAEDVAIAATLLAGSYTLLATNVPYLTSNRQNDVLRGYVERNYSEGRPDLATAFQLRLSGWTSPGGTTAVVTPQLWRLLVSYAPLRRRLLSSATWDIMAVLGPGAFETIAGEVVNVMLLVMTSSVPSGSHAIPVLDLSAFSGAVAKMIAATDECLVHLSQSGQLANPDSRVLTEDLPTGPSLGAVASSLQGISTADLPRFSVYFWELPGVQAGWEFWQGAPDVTALYRGRSKLIDSARLDEIVAIGGAIRGTRGWGKRGVVVSQMGSFQYSLYDGDKFDTNVAALIPRDPALLPALWCMCESGEMERLARILDAKVNVTNATFEHVPFDVGRWSAVAAEQYPAGLPAPCSDDPSQWLFDGRIDNSTSPLHTAVARLLGYCWPMQELEAAGRLSDADGIVCLPPVGGERSAADRLHELLVTAHGDRLSNAALDHMLSIEGSPDLESWLRDSFFTSHCRLFNNRPFVWQVWDGRKDGFSALLNYHRLDKATLEKLTFSTLQWWVDRQRAEAASGVIGAESRLGAALDLQQKLAAIVEGEPPFDIYARWKPASRQAIGWNPDLNDGVRLNIRPFVNAGVLRAGFNINWNKDRGKNPDGSERLNDLHYTVEEKLNARGER